MERRKLLRGAAAMTVLAVGGGVWRAVERGVFAVGEGPAYAPWRDFRTDRPGGALELVRAAVLAANPHNTQPWLFRVTASRIDVFANPRRNIGAIDPLLREMHVGVGCALENLLLAAEAHGLHAQVALAPTAADPTHAARIDLTPGAARATALYQAIPRRHTNRGAYRAGAPLSSAVQTELQALGGTDPELRVFWLSSAAERAKAAQLVVAATQAIIADQEQSRDSAKWYRLEWEQVQKYRDGITVDALGAGPALRAVAKWFPPLSMQQNDAFWLQTTRDVHVATAAAFGILAVRNPDDLSQRLRCGMLWQRMQLWATVHGVALHPLNQMPERATREHVLRMRPRFGDALRELAGDSGWHALMFFRGGYPLQPALASPRRAVQAVLL
jgi:hypothetical protein